MKEYTNHNNALSKEGIIAHLATDTLGRDVHFFESVTSTFDEADKLSVRHGTLICAKRQTNGRGRLGRQWLSQRGGIYLSLIICPRDDVTSLQVYTAICALGVQRAISSLVPCSIKWPNDIVSSQSKKLCGILCKAKFAGDECEYINVGIGINANNHPQSSELMYASSVSECALCEINENALIADVLCQIESCINADDTDALMQEFAKVCLTIGSDIRVIYPNGNELRGRCTGLGNDGAIMVSTNDGTTIEVNSGEVSVRGIYGEDYV